MAQIKIEITYDPNKETLEQAVSSLTPRASSAKAVEPAFTIEAAIAAQRFIAANQVDSYIEYLRDDLKLTPEQIGAVCGEYVQANANFFQDAEPDTMMNPDPKPADKPEAEASATATTSSKKSETTKKVSKTDVRAVATALSKAGKREALSAIFAEFGGKKLSDIKEEDYPTLMEKLEAANG